jgi:hypothetical protein
LTTDDRWHAAVTHRQALRAFATAIAVICINAKIKDTVEKVGWPELPANPSLYRNKNIVEFQRLLYCVSGSSWHP